ncbi:MAG: TIR domain-containing protein [bacterium]|nr:TIR domain-containing protein [bacterium]
MPTKVFISYKKTDTIHSKSESLHLYHDLKKAGFDVFRDDEVIGVGEAWQEKIYENVRDSDVLIVLLEPKTAESEWVQREVDLARGAQVSILPLRVGHKDVNFTREQIADVQKKLVILDKNYGFYASDDYANKHMSDGEKEEAKRQYSKLLDSIRSMAKKTRKAQREWAKSRLMRHALYPADSNSTYHAFNVQNKRGDTVTIYLAVGDLTEFENIDVIVNSENNYMQMARFFENTTLSSTLRRKGSYNLDDAFLEDSVQRELDERVRAIYINQGQFPVPLEKVLVTSPGHKDSILANKEVRYIFHASTNQVITADETYELQPFSGERIRRCVVNCLNKVNEVDETIESIVFPIFGTGHNGMGIGECVPHMMDGMLRFIRNDDKSNLKRIHLCVYSSNDVDEVKHMMEVAINPR